MPLPELGLFAALTLGFRHSLDPDHIAALLDIGASSSSRLQSLKGSALYAAGHAFMVMIMGLAIVSLQTEMPAWISDTTEKVVGVTLIFLSIMVVVAIYRGVTIGSEVSSPRRLLLGYFGIKDNSLSSSGRINFAIGMTHGIGVESPTQVMALTTFAAASSGASGSAARSLLLLSVFAISLLISNVISAWLISGGFMLSRMRGGYFILAVFSALFSVLLGIELLLS